MTINALPPAPSRADDPENFSLKADAFVAALPPLVTQINADGAILNANATIASNAATTASTKASEAAASATSAAGAAGASMWVSGSYSTGATAWSPTNYQTYRAKTTGSKTTDPSLDDTNWALISAGAINHFVLQAAGIL